MQQLNYEVHKRPDTTWSALFQQMENIATNFKIVDYSLSQTTLEQVGC